MQCGASEQQPASALNELSDHRDVLFVDMRGAPLVDLNDQDIGRANRLSVPISDLFEALGEADVGHLDGVHAALFDHRSHRKVVR